jgi:hypothetical protein
MGFFDGVLDLNRCSCDKCLKAAQDNINAFEQMKDHLCACTEKPKEKICANCRWGTIFPDNFEGRVFTQIQCHYMPEHLYKSKNDFCSKFEEK